MVWRYDDAADIVKRRLFCLIREKGYEQSSEARFRFKLLL